jgi:hypothetical protein
MPVAGNAQLSETYRLLYQSGDGMTGIRNMPAPDFLSVKVVNASGLAEINYPVTFTVVRGGGHFNGEISVDLFTDQSGIASVRPTLGPIVGENINQFRAQAFTNDGKPLQGSPIEFLVSAKKSNATKMIIYSGDGQSAQAQTFLPNPLKIKILDESDQPVANHEVLFRVISGSGQLGSEQSSQLTKTSDSYGIVEVIYRLGPEIGLDNHIVEVSSDDGIAPLVNSPLYFHSSAPFGNPDPDRSLVIAPSHVVADGQSEAQITIELRDMMSKPIQGEQVMIFVSGSHNGIRQPETLTDQYGRCTAWIRSTKAEMKTVTVRLPSTDLWLNQTALVLFTAGPPQNLQQISGDGQTEKIGTPLPDPLVVRLLDAFDNPVDQAPVFFDMPPEAGSMTTIQPVYSDSNGYARDTWILGNFIGSHQVIVYTPNCTDTVKFTAMVSTPSRLAVIKVNGDEQFTPPGQIFQDSLEVRIVDPFNNQVGGIDVQFVVFQGDVQLSASQEYSDRYGLARVQLSAGWLTGAVLVRAMLADTIYAEFHCAVSRSIPDSMIPLYGDGLVVAAGDTIPLLAVQVLDDQHRPVANVPITFKSETPGARILGEPVMRTNNIGQAVGRALLGTRSGTYFFSASDHYLKGSPVIFRITGVPRAAAKMQILSGQYQQGKPGQVLPELLSVRISDEYDNGVPLLPITFAVLAGGGEISQPQPVLADSDGTVSTAWKLGQSGEQIVAVTTPALPYSAVVFYAVFAQNQPPVIMAPQDTTIMEGQTLTFVVDAVDPEGEQVIINAIQLPRGASFDPGGSRRFTWTPGLDQDGNYMVILTATDGSGVSSQHHLNIHVMNKNQPPVIVSFEPADTLVTGYYFEPLSFKIKASDGDRDPLQFNWTVNDEHYVNMNTLQVLPNGSMPSHITVTGWVSDGQDSVAQKWHIDLLQLEVSACDFKGYFSNGFIELAWENKSSSDIVLFHVMRATQPDGVYENIHTEKISPDHPDQFYFRDRPSGTAQKYYYKLEAISNTGKIFNSEPVEINVILPGESSLHQNYPNPFNQETTIHYDLPASENIQLQIFDLSGKKVRTIFYGPAPAGFHSIVWDGKNDNGYDVTSGTYFCVLASPHWRKHIKLLYLK